MISADFVDSVLTKPMDRESYTKTVGKGHGGCSQFGFRLTGPLPEPSPRYLAKAQFIRWHKDLPEKIWPGETVDTLFDDTRDFSGLIAGDLEDLRRFFARSRSAGYRMLQFGIPEEAWSGLEVLLKSYPQHTITQYVGIPKDGFELALKARKELRFSGAGRPWIEIAAPKAKTLQEIGDFFYRLRPGSLAGHTTAITHGYPITSGQGLKPCLSTTHTPISGLLSSLGTQGLPLSSRGSGKNVLRKKTDTRHCFTSTEKEKGEIHGLQL